MRKAILAVAVSAMLVVGLGATSASASEVATPGPHQAHVVVTSGSSYVVVDIYYRVEYETPKWVGVTIDHANYESHPSQYLDALCIDMEQYLHDYEGNFCVGAPSTTYDDVPPTGTFASGAFKLVTNDDYPAFRVRAYGLGNVHTRTDAYVEMT